MQKIKVYNLAKLIQDNFTDKQIHSQERMAVMVGESGVTIFDREAIGYEFKSTEESITIDLTDILKPNTHRMFPQYTVDVSIQEILDQAEYEEMELLAFLEKHDYNTRCRCNYKLLLNVIKTIGLDKKDFIEV